MKIVNCLRAKLLLIAILCGCLVASEIGIGGLKKVKSSNKKLRAEMRQVPGTPASPAGNTSSQVAQGSAVKKSQDLPNIPVYFEGWIKYLHYTERDSKKPKAFYKNPEFEVQNKKNLSPQKLKQSDKVILII